jgi:hypothetical protein
MLDLRAGEFLRQLRSGEPQEAWASFLELCSPLILDVVSQFERDDDAVGNCYLFVCDHLRRNGFRRLLRFRADGPASFPTWLRAVVRNLCVDWHRQEFGRHRIFESVARLPALDQDIFRSIFVECLPAQEAYLQLRSRVPGLTLEGLREGIERVQRALTPRQRWLLSLRWARAAHAFAGPAWQGEEFLEQIRASCRTPSRGPASRKHGPRSPGAWPACRRASGC